MDIKTAEAEIAKRILEDLEQCSKIYDNVVERYQKCMEEEDVEKLLKTIEWLAHTCSSFHDKLKWMLEAELSRL